MLADPTRTLRHVPALPGPDGRLRCPWAIGDAEYLRYHDEEWGVPLHGDRALFEKLSLEGFQSGLSWITILKRRDGFREAFSGFEPERVAAFDETDAERLLADVRIIRNRAKIEAVIGNARALIALQAERGDGALDALVWSHAPSGAPEPRPAEPTDLPASTAGSAALSRDLKALGFRFVGPVTAYALMQSGGLVDDHLTTCFRSTTARAHD